MNLQASSDKQDSAGSDATKDSRAWGRYVVLGFVAVLLYVMSSGLAWRSVPGTGIGPRLLDTVYRPLVWSYQYTPLHKPIGMYWHLWQPELFLKNGNTFLDLS